MKTVAEATTRLQMAPGDRTVGSRPNKSVLVIEDQRAHVLIGKSKTDRSDPRRGFEGVELEAQAPSVRP